jgi:hypothetical protein
MEQQLISCAAEFRLLIGCHVAGPRGRVMVTLAQLTRQRKKQMRTTFGITASGGLVSKIQECTIPHELTAGIVVQLSKPFAAEFGEVPEGARGIVDHVSEDDGSVWIRMIGIYPALIYWDNFLVISPFECEDLVTSLRLPVDKKVPCAAILERWELASCIYFLLQLC